MSKNRKIETPRDVFNHFGATWDESKSLDENNRYLSRRLYKDWDCGPWGRCYPPSKTRVGCEKEIWWLHAWKDGSEWKHSFHRAEFGPEVSDVPVDVTAYFWPWDSFGCEGSLESDLAMITAERGCPNPNDFWLAEQLGIPVFRENAGTFVVGSTVEDSDGWRDQEAIPIVVELPCMSDDLDAAVKDVERQVEDILLVREGQVADDSE